MSTPTNWAPVSTTAPRRRVKYIYGQGNYQLWLLWLDKCWQQRPRHFARRAALVRARSLGLSADEITDEVLARCAVSGDPRRERKVRADIAKFFHSEPDTDGTARSSAPVVLFDPELRKRVAAGAVLGLSDLLALSPTKPPDCEQIIDALFSPRELLCVASSISAFVTKPREELRGRLRHFQFICPQPMIKVRGRNRAGVLSFHTLDNCGPWTYLVLEWDVSSASIDEQARMLIHLRDNFPARLGLIVHSGGESLHGWFYVKHWPIEQREEFAAYALRLGACSGTIKNRSQFVRMPDGLRRWPATGKRTRQTVHYFDAEAFA